ncbi:DUF4184 family protein [Adhaeribacter pallidiroseus]|uniref:DUF4184 family protein n=1 Tax=Adhaeribacter pallidiroseus TaxID=2072847 RepID=A0A369QQX9_9BACT|nr:DUF4184 family protein [Adhaeribacter pallidiroseus]RDC66085.1 hypothetical protein AHMF7616_04716 [Adhaeribacter pallidiroseus]
MPFTFSHPAIVLPFYYLPKKTRSMTGLVIGSMVPDFEKFFRMSHYDGFSHTWPAIFYFNLPLAILLSFAFHQVARNSLIDNLPLFLKKRLLPYKQFNWLRYFKNHYLVIILSILVGVVSHLTWDSLTHPGGQLFELFPILSKWIRYPGFHMWLYVLIDRISSVIGGLVIVVAILKLPTYFIPHQADSKSSSYWLFMGLIILIIMSLRLLIGVDAKFFVMDVLITLISASLWSLIVTPYFLKFYKN